MKTRAYSYVIDRVDGKHLPQLYRALAEVTELTSIDFNRNSRILTVEAAWDPERAIRLVCETVGVDFRARLRN